METEIKNLITKRGLIKSKLTRLENFFKTCTDKGSIIQLKLRIAKTDNIYQEFDDLQSQIEILVQDGSQNIERDNFEGQYFEVMANVEAFIQRVSVEGNSNEGNNSSNSLQSDVQVKLPTLRLPFFTGQIEEWISFKETFCSLINENDNLNNVQRFHYLRSCLKGDAANHIATLGVSSENYPIAWDLLKRRFENKRLIIKSHVNSLFTLPAVIRDSSVSLRKLLDSVLMHIKVLKCLGLPTDSWDVLIIHLITSRFDVSTLKEWECFTKEDIPKMSEMSNFLMHRCQMLESLNCNKDLEKTSSNSRFQTARATVRHTALHVTTSNQKCKICNDNHLIHQCNQFLRLSIESRIKKIRELNLCLNCFKSNHVIKNCYAGNCKTCNKRHNTLLHLTTENVKNVTSPTSSEIENPVPSNTHSFAVNDSGLNNTLVNNHCSHYQGLRQVLLSTAIVQIPDERGNLHDCRCLLDVGSQANFISRAFCKTLGLATRSINIPILGINQSSAPVKEITNLIVKSRYSSFTCSIPCLILTKITENLPSSTFSISKFQLAQGIHLADPNFNVSAPIDLLLGAEVFWKILGTGQMRMANDRIHMQETQFGWIFGGRVNLNQPLHVTFCNTTLTKLEKQVTRFWEIEEGKCSQIYSLEESKCEEHFIKTHTRTIKGRFVVRLPLKDDSKVLGESRKNALQRFYSLERKFKVQPKFKERYEAFITDYVRLNHMEEVTGNESQESSGTFYLPHHAVIKEASTTTKLRVVFDASAKTTSGVSLNDKLMVGPTIQQDLFSIITRFRTHQYVLTADVTKMYRQVILDKADRDLQRILWRSNPEEPIRTYRLTTVTYGTASAPFLAVRCLQEIANAEMANAPAACEVIKRDFYVDDLLTGTNTLEQGIRLRKEISHILSKAGFELCKWASNHPALVDNGANMSINFDNEGETKTLGLIWNCHQDVFKYVLDASEIQGRPTKRLILSNIAKLFDPLGLIGPVLVVGKLILQMVWAEKLKWDEHIPNNILRRWNEFTANLHNINTLNIPRGIRSYCTLSETFQLHGFCDASQTAYGACIYIRSTNSRNGHYAQLLCAKSRVAPLKTVTLPRLELSGALLLAQLSKRVSQTLELNISKFYYWCDSKIVLSWILATPNIWKTFVANRVGEIQGLTNINDWHHVRSIQNPADILSRGCSVNDLEQSKLWWNGPHWLMEDSHTWPISVTESENETTVEEMRACLITTTSPVEATQSIIVKYSSFTKLQRVIGYCLRFVHNSKNPTNKRSNNLSSTELYNATKSIIKLVQRKEFCTEYNDLKRNGSVHIHSKLVSLNPFVDDEGIIRVGGRLRNSSLPANTKYPIILPPKHHITKLLIIQEHHNHLHAGPQQTLAALRQNFWPLSARTTVRQVVYNCVKCFRVKPVSVEQLMGDLPASRVEPARPFLNSGVDYAGPVLLREGRCRTRKAYICLFICFATKAIHLELVGDLTTQSFLNTLKRFIARRGNVLNLYSDNATTFIGAKRELQELSKMFNEQGFERVTNELTAKNITWHFIPPKSPNFGGLWEAGIKSTKFHLKRIVGNALLTYEEMYTVLTSIEACLNSRPLTPLSNHPTDLTPLTPSHFLIGEPLTTLVEPDVTHLKLNRISRHQLIVKLRQDFWNRWSKEYLGQLQQRRKWQRATHVPIQPGLLVVLKDDGLPPLKWQLGRIMEVHPGGDNIVRVVTVKTGSGVVKRAVGKVCVLPIDSELEQP